MIKGQKSRGHIKPGYSKKNALKCVRRCKIISSSENEEEDYDQIIPSKKKTWHKKRIPDSFCVTQVKKSTPSFIHKETHSIRENLLNLYGSDIELNNCESNVLPAATLNFETEK
ncbi:uncharacterized protein LOC124813459 [Hydra vulgaris]|uniref:uncharacterized protein LOC124813459 n=1 Tax=Hydra vulgaris TaxID=6087 RepID=UPI001F5E90D3|nr:uncharacterized protein LOC124813459 [Hydra vulgaris]